MGVADQEEQLYCEHALVYTATNGLRRHIDDWQKSWKWSKLNGGTA